MKNIKVLTCLCVALVLSTSCNRSGTNASSQQVQASMAKRYRMKGKVVSIDPQAKMANIDGEAIPGFMEAMTMPYVVKPESTLGQLRPGEGITADVVVQDEKEWLENVTVISHAEVSK